MPSVRSSLKVAGIQALLTRPGPDDLAAAGRELVERLRFVADRARFPVRRRPGRIRGLAWSIRRRLRRTMGRHDRFSVWPGSIQRFGDELGDEPADKLGDGPAQLVFDEPSSGCPTGAAS